MEQFKKSLERFQSAINYIQKYRIDLNKKINPAKSIYDFKEKQSDCYIRLYRNAFEELKYSLLNLNQLPTKSNDVNVIKIGNLLKGLEKEYTANNINKINQILKEIISLDLPSKFQMEKVQKLDIKIRDIPDDINADIRADLKELESCFNAKCYRSCVILCGRLLEIALHRKYYESTGQDILEKNPGIGLGNLIVKLKDKNINLDPALTNQIHLINQARIFSVHKKKEAFYPSKSQAHAIILYTIDVIEKIFDRKAPK